MNDIDTREAFSIINKFLKAGGRLYWDKNKNIEFICFSSLFVMVTTAKQFWGTVPSFPNLSNPCKSGKCPFIGTLIYKDNPEQVKKISDNKVLDCGRKVCALLNRPDIKRILIYMNMVGRKE